MRLFLILIAPFRVLINEKIAINVPRSDRRSRSARVTQPLPARPSRHLASPCCVCVCVVLRNFYYVTNLMMETFSRVLSALARFNNGRPRRRNTFRRRGRPGSGAHGTDGTPFDASRDPMHGRDASSPNSAGRWCVRGLWGAARSRRRISCVVFFFWGVGVNCFVWFVNDG